MRWLITYLRLAWSDKQSVILIVLLFIKAIILVKHYPLSRYKKRFINNVQNQNFLLQQYQAELSLIYKVKKKIPFKITCLMESIVIQDFFKRYKLDIQIFLGINKTEKLNAHAWCVDKTNLNYQFILST